MSAQASERVTLLEVAEDLGTVSELIYAAYMATSFLGSDEDCNALQIVLNSATKICRGAMSSFGQVAVAGVSRKAS